MTDSPNVESTQPLQQLPRDEEERAYVCRDIVLVRRVLSRLTVYGTDGGGFATLTDAATPAHEIHLRTPFEWDLGHINSSELETITKEESLRARSLASTCQAG